MSLKDSIARANANPAREKVRVDAWGEDVWVRAITAAERLQIEDFVAVADKVPGKNLEILIRTIVLAVCDETGNRVFSDGDDDLDLLRRTDARALRQVFDAAARLNALTSEAQEEVQKKSNGRLLAGLPTG